MPSGIVMPSGLAGDLGAGSGVVDPQGLTKMDSAKICTLLSANEAGAIMKATVTGTPTGMLMAGLGTNCIYNSTNISGPSIKIEFNTLGYQAQAAMVGIGGKPQSLTIAGHTAVGVDARTNSLVEAQVVVNLGSDAQSVALYVEAPTLDEAKQVAEMVVPRIAGLK